MWLFDYKTTVAGWAEREGNRVGGRGAEEGERWGAGRGVEWV